MTFDRRQLLALMLAGTVSPAFGQAAMTSRTAYGFSFPALKGERHQARRYRRQADAGRQHRLECGYTPQYAGLQELWKRYASAASWRRRTVQRFRRAGAGRRQGDQRALRIRSYGVGFPSREGRGARAGRASVLQVGRGGEPAELPRWNFHKYLIGRDGHIVGEPSRGRSTRCHRHTCHCGDRAPARRRAEGDQLSSWRILRFEGCAIVSADGTLARASGDHPPS